MTLSPSSGDVALAKQAVHDDPDTPDELADLFDGTTFRGSEGELSAIRTAMKRAEDASRIGDDKSYYDARLALQFIDRDPID